MHHQKGDRLSAKWRGLSDVVNFFSGCTVRPKTEPAVTGSEAQMAFTITSCLESLRPGTMLTCRSKVRNSYGKVNMSLFTCKQDKQMCHRSRSQFNTTESVAACQLEILAFVLFGWIHIAWILVFVATKRQLHTLCSTFQNTKCVLNTKEHKMCSEIHWKSITDLLVTIILYLGSANLTNTKWAEVVLSYLSCRPALAGLTRCHNMLWQCAW